MANILLPQGSVRMHTDPREIDRQRMIAQMYGVPNWRAPMYPESPYAYARAQQGGQNVIDLSRMSDGSYGQSSLSGLARAVRHRHGLYGLGLPDPATVDLQTYLDAVAQAAGPGVVACRQGQVLQCPADGVQTLQQAEMTWLAAHPAPGSPGSVTSPVTGFTTVAPPPPPPPTSATQPGISQSDASAITGKPNQSVPPNPQPGTVPMGSGIPQTGQSMSQQQSAETGGSNITLSSGTLLLIGLGAAVLFLSRGNK